MHQWLLFEMSKNSPEKLTEGSPKGTGVGSRGMLGLLGTPSGRSLTPLASPGFSTLTPVTPVSPACSFRAWLPPTPIMSKGPLGT